MTSKTRFEKPPDILGIIKGKTLPKMRPSYSSSGKDNGRYNLTGDGERDHLFQNGYSGNNHQRAHLGDFVGDATDGVKLSKLTIANGRSSSTIYIGASPSSTPGTRSPEKRLSRGSIGDADLATCRKHSSPVDADAHSDEHFYMNEMTHTNGKHTKNGVPHESGEDEHPFFVGSRDVRDPASLKEMKIVSARGTVRGYKNRVRAGIASFIEKQDSPDAKNMRIVEKGKVVLYTTSMRIVRETHDKCKRVKNILQTHMVQYEEKDIFMSRENQETLMNRLGINHVDVPQVFADGQHLGNAEQLEVLNENGELRRIFKQFNKVSHLTSCEKCGGYQYVPCSSCHGSKKSLHRNHFTEEFCALRCTVCDENGLVKCDFCAYQQGV